MREHSPIALILDLSHQPAAGLESLQQLRSSGNDLPVLVVCTAGDLRTARSANDLGATQIYPPLSGPEVVDALENTLASHQLRCETALRRSLSRGTVEEVLGDAATLDSLRHHMSRLREVDAATVLITGESGTGKTVVARSIHAHGPRGDLPFLELACSGLSDEELLGELLGNESSPEDSFSRGLLELANGGVVVLDRVCDLSLEAQAVVEQALDTGTFRRRGSSTDIPFSTAIYASTTRDLRAEVDAGRFRRDLFLRLGATRLHLPPLRERTSDVPTLAQHFLTAASQRYRVSQQSWSPAALEQLQAYSWPGNVRELRNLVERLTILSPSAVLQPEHLPADVRFHASQTLAESLEGCPFLLPPSGLSLDLVERGLISQALTRTGGNQSAAARLLGISRYALRYRMEKHELAG